MGLFAMTDFEDIGHAYGGSEEATTRREDVLAVSLVSRTSISFKGQHLSATSLPAVSAALVVPVVGAPPLLRLATRTASSKMTNRTILMTLYVAAFSSQMPSISATTCLPGVAGANLAEPDI